MLSSTRRSACKSLALTPKHRFENLIQRPVDFFGVNAIINFKTHLILDTHQFLAMGPTLVTFSFLEYTAGILIYKGLNKYFQHKSQYDTAISKITEKVIPKQTYLIKPSSVGAAFFTVNLILLGSRAIHNHMNRKQIKQIYLILDSFLWIQNLSHYDPYFILPIFVGLATYFNIRYSDLKTLNQDHNRFRLCNLCFMTCLATSVLPSSYLLFIITILLSRGIGQYGRYRELVKQRKKLMRQLQFSEKEKRNLTK